ncbi:uncharacterized protein LOC117653377 [Thrips palmi]|uniref:Uncharacterized protein LOC117653377 n=1 Tax=Thrips palmi TaxID=161013 RepID=A0A6P9ABQ1_THRPL|nr:uncharacterized protein LOC117653377 [Thrips palmi]XP_034254905.1 uncharacterized protein LOC117653377 [Thrips palmi]
MARRRRNCKQRKPAAAANTAKQELTKEVEPDKPKVKNERAEVQTAAKTVNVSPRKPSRSSSNLSGASTSWSSPESVPKGKRKADSHNDRGVTPTKRKSDIVAEVVVKQEKNDSVDHPLRLGEAHNNIITSIKDEEVDCGVDNLEAEAGGAESLVAIVEQASYPDVQSREGENLVASVGSIPSLIAEWEKSFNAVLPDPWMCKSTHDGFDFMYLSSGRHKAIQRQLFISFQGELEISIHRHVLPPSDVNELLKGFKLPAILVVEQSFNDFLGRVLIIIRILSNLGVCRGADHSNMHQGLWLQEKNGVFDNNPYAETSYSLTFRSTKCKRLVPLNVWVCEECVRLAVAFSKKQGSSPKLPTVFPMVPSSGPPMSGHNDVLPSSDSCAMKEEMVHCSSKPSLMLTNPSNSASPMMSNHQVESQAQVVSKNSSPVCTDLSVKIVSAYPSIKNIKPNQLMAGNVVRCFLPLGKEVPKPPKTYSYKDVNAPLDLAMQNQKIVQSVLEKRCVKIKLLLEKCAVPIDNKLSKDLLDILEDLKNPTSVQQQFIDMQEELAAQKRATGMKWYPTLIRYALFMRSTSQLGSGMITLPSGKALFNFSQVLFKIKNSFQKADVSCFRDKPYLKNCNLIGSHNIVLIDEINVIDNLVYQKSNSELIGFVKLSDVKCEMDKIEEFIVADKCLDHRPIPSYTMLAYMVKGINNNLREVVGLLDAEDDSPQKVYDATWDVISTLEQNAFKVVGVVTNGSLKTKNFIDLHSGLMLDSGQVYATKNIAAKDRLIYFFTDMWYLLRQIRNCFEESGSNGVNQRILTKNKEKIVWKTIEKLYLARKWQRPMLMLDNLDIYLDEHSRKIPSHASAVFCTAVVNFLRKFCSYTPETVTFISKVCDTFSCLLKTVQAEEPLKPYTSPNDSRFSSMLGLLDYLSEWKAEVQDIPYISEDDKSKLLLDETICLQTEMSVRAFIDCALFLLKEGVKEVDANTFWLEPLETYLQFGWFGFLPSSNSHNMNYVNKKVDLTIGTKLLAAKKVKKPFPLKAVK